MKPSIKTGILRAIMGTTLIACLLLSVVLIMMARADVASLSREHLQGLEQSSSTYFDRAMADAITQLADNLINPLYYSEFDYIRQQLASTESQLVVESAALLDPDATIVQEADRDFARLGTRVELSNQQLEQLRRGELLMDIHNGQRTALKGVLLGDQLLGIVEVKSQPYAMFEQIQAIYQKLEASTQRMLLVYSLGAGAITLTLMILAGLTSWFVANRLTQPIHRLREQAEYMSSGNLQIKDRIDRDDEIGDLARSMYAMAADLELQNRSVKYLAFHDPLTGLCNRSSFQMDLEDQMVRCNENGTMTCALIFIDIDDFKSINDASGHDLGDRTLKVLADRISDAVLDQVEEGDEQPSIARIGGDEFTILVPGSKTDVELRQIAERILEAIARPLLVENEVHQISGSIGIARYPSDGNSPSSLLNAADKAMYNSKFAGKGTYRFFDSSMAQEDQSSHRIKTEFKQALAQPNELELLYQPIVQIETGEIYGGEALMRWHHPKMGTLEPGQFISVVEHNEIALAADLWVIESTLNMLESLDLRQRPNFVLSANISASNLGREQFPQAVARLLKQSPVNPRHIQLEITETYLHRDEEKALQSLNALQALGVKLWLDDFCTGYSSLKHLHMFPANGIKIDRQFVINMNKRNEDRLLVNAMISLADSFNIGVVAEGIDNQADRELLLALGCPLGQGDLFSKPLPVGQFVELLHSGARLPLSPKH